MTRAQLARKVREFGKLSPRNQKIELEKLYGGFSDSVHGKTVKAVEKEQEAALKAKGV